MKYLSHGAAAALLLMSTASLAVNEGIDDASKTDYSSSRFKIFTAQHEAVTSNGKVVTIQSIFKIDLETGTVWRYRQGVDQKGKPFEEFFEIPNQ